jgi:hypothetical protein
MPNFSIVFLFNLLDQYILYCGCSKFREDLQEEGALDVETRLENEFPAWFRGSCKLFQNLFLNSHVVL